MNATFELEEAAYENDIPFTGNELDVIRLAIRCGEQLFVGLTYEEAERWLESYEDSFNWEND